jgi:hypothetical protein
VTSETELLHGAALHKLVRGLGRVTIESLGEIHPSLYLVQGIPICAGVLLKICTKGQRHPPRWQFVLTPNELGAVRQFRKERPRCSVFFALVCRDDGVCCVPENDAYRLIGGGSGVRNPFLSVSRPTGGSYHVRGPQRTELGHAIPQSDWPGALDVQS